MSEKRDRQADAAPGETWLVRATAAVAIVGGLLALAVAGLSTASVLGRWLRDAPIEGDFEFVRMATAVAIFCYLPYAQARGANIMVDTFTARLSARTRGWMDAFWSLLYAAFMGLIAYALTRGALDARENGETTMQLQIALWPSIAVSAALCALLALTALATARDALRGAQDGRTR